MSWRQRSTAVSGWHPPRLGTPGWTSKRYPMTRWASALAGIATGGNANLVLTGDSTTYGVGATSPYVGGITGALVAWANSAGGLNVPTRYGGSCPSSYGTAYTTFAGGWGSSIGGNEGFGITAYCGASSTAPMRVFAPEACDSFRVIFATKPGNGTIKCTATGGVEVTASTDAAIGFGYVDAVCASSGTGKYVDISCVGAVRVLSVEANLSGWNGLKIHCGGAPGMRLQQCRATIPSFMAWLDPDCIACAWGINDNSTGYTPAVFMGYVDTFLNGMPSTPNKVWIAPFSYQGAGNAVDIRMQAYQTSLRANLAARGIRHYDPSAEINYGWNTDWGANNTVHLLTTGYTKWAEWYEMALIP